MAFKNLGLAPKLLQGIQAMGYHDPTPIQLRSIPPALTGRDLIGSAQTGTGKTAAFALPTLQRLERRGNLRCLVLEPTRELAAQVDTAFRNIGRFTDLRVTALFGGVGYGNQRKTLQQGVDIVVATPGRLEDHLKQRTMHLRDIEILILDEVDRMLDIGFLPAVKRLVAQCPKNRQTLFFSATVPPEIADLANFALRDPVRVEIGVTRSVSNTVTHGVYRVGQGQKFDLLLALLNTIDFQSVIVFSRTKHGADKIAKKLRVANHTVAVLHSNRSQNQRIEALAGFKSGKYEVMVATDIAARGIDIAGVSHVINYDIPEHPEDYVHRIGRTGRAEKVGDAFTLVTPDDYKKLRDIERFIGRPIERLHLDGFTAPPETAAAHDRSTAQRQRRPHHQRPHHSTFVNAKGERSRHRR
jgi:ATP-dependent RNA helicase RhlE